jgi:cysteine/O-acetylserine efflux protein
MPAQFLPLLSYVLVSTFTPGPSNLSSASIAVLHGYRNTLKYQAGLAAGVFLLMFLSGWLSAALLGLFPSLEPWLRYLGAAYIVYLAVGLLQAGYTFAGGAGRPLGFFHGLTLQLLNPKLIVYAFTLFTAFLFPLAMDVARLVLTAVALAAVSFAATSLWALFGTAIKTYLRNPRLKMVVNLLLSLSLIYTAIALAGFL